jgi:uncharacterized OB-fold protein
MNSKIEISQIYQIRYEQLISQLQNYVPIWRTQYQKCKKCGTYNPIGNVCVICNSKN